MKAELKAVNSKMNNAEERISDLEDRLGKYPVKRADRKPNEKKKSNIRDLWGNNIKQASLCRD